MIIVKYSSFFYWILDIGYLILDIGSTTY